MDAVTLDAVALRHSRCLSGGGRIHVRDEVSLSLSLSFSLSLHAYTHTHTHTHTNIEYTHKHTHTYTHTYTHTWVAYMRTRPHTHKHGSIRSLFLATAKDFSPRILSTPSSAFGP